METQNKRSGMALLERHQFADDFIFGTASSAYQYEGAANEGGRGQSVWDQFTHKWPGKIADGRNGTTAVDFYHQYKEDVKMMKRMGLDAFRFSISWPRILPTGKLSGGVNKEGIKFYNDLIDELLSNGLTPFVTLFHWDLPLALADEYGGFLSTQIVADFCDFAEVCFWEFGDRVKHWITINEPWTYCNSGYVLGTYPPGHGATSSTPLHSSSTDQTKSLSDDKFMSSICTHRFYTTDRQGPCTARNEDNGNPGTEPYIVTHNLILAHAAVANLYKAKFQDYQKGKIGITLISHWFVPYSDSKEDRDAADRAKDFMFGWFMGPLVNGDYPRSMRELVKERLPRFDKYPIKVKDSFDFIGVNYYTAQYAAFKPKSNGEKLSYSTDPDVSYTYVRNGIPIGPKSGADWLYIYPQGFYDLLTYTKTKYKNPLIYITENGVCEADDVKLTINDARHDDMRKDYHISHLRYLRDAINDGVNVKGYFAWSFMDNFEWAAGYNPRFGFIYVDHKDGYLARFPKDSAVWFSDFLKKDAKKFLTN